MRQPRVRTRRWRTPGRGAALVACVVGLGLVLSSCSWVSGLFGGNSVDKGVPQSVFDISAGDCFVAPAKVKAELSDLSKVPCSVPHEQEAYASVKYAAPANADYPGNAALDTYAKGSCAQAFSGYVGIAYQDSSLWLTYLLPSARSWQQSDDRTVWCFVTTTGQPLTKSVKGSKL